jgi:hypothetical protein
MLMSSETRTTRDLSRSLGCFKQLRSNGRDRICKATLTAPIGDKSLPISYWAIDGAAIDD